MERYLTETFVPLNDIQDLTLSKDEDYPDAIPDAIPGGGQLYSQPERWRDGEER